MSLLTLLRSSGTTETNTVFSSSGVAAVSFSGAAVVAAVFSASGSAASSFTPQDAVIFTSAGRTTGTFVSDTGSTFTDTVFSAAGSADATFEGQRIAEVDLVASGIAAASFSGQSVIPTDLSSDGLATVGFSGAALLESVATFPGTSAFSASIESAAETDLSSAGVATMGAVGEAFAEADLSITGSSLVAFDSAQATGTTFTSDGVGTFSAVGDSIRDTVLASDGVAAASFSSALIRTTALEVEGIGTFSATSGATIAATLTSSGTGQLSAVGASTADSALAAAGVAAASFAVDFAASDTVLSASGVAEFTAVTRPAGLIFVERFEASPGYDATWSNQPVVGTGGVFDPDASTSLVDNPPAWGMEALHVISGSGGNAFRQHDFADTFPDIFLRFDLIVKNMPDPGANQVQLVLVEGDMNPILDVDLFQSAAAGNPKFLRFNVYETPSVAELVIHEINLDELYRVEFAWKTETLTWEIRVNFVAIPSGAGTITTPRDMRSFRIGFSGEPDDDLEVFADNILMHTEEFPEVQNAHDIVTLGRIFASLPGISKLRGRR